MMLITLVPLILAEAMAQTRMLVPVYRPRTALGPILRTTVSCRLWPMHWRIVSGAEETLLDAVREKAIAKVAEDQAGAAHRESAAIDEGFGLWRSGQH